MRGTKRCAPAHTVVAALPSSSVPANRDLSAVMRSHLNRIAANNGGVVPLHGRLFVQWLHHVYPRECPCLHLSGRTWQQQPRAFAQMGRNITAARSQMAAHAGEDAQAWKRLGQSRPLENTLVDPNQVLGRLNAKFAERWNKRAEPRYLQTGDEVLR